MMGQKYASYNDEGTITAFYDSVDSPLPDACKAYVAITDAQWLACITTPGYTVQNGDLVEPPAPTTAQLIANAQAAQIATLTTAYQNAVVQPVTFTTAGGVTKVFQADTNSQTILLQSVTGFNMAGAVPADFFWKSQDNTEVPFTLSDLKGLYAAMLAQGWAAFQRLSTQKAAVNAASTVAAVQAITW